MTKTALDFLQTVTPFHLLPKDTLLSLSEVILPREIPAGTIIYHQNQSQLKELSLIVSGEVEKYIEDEQGRRSNQELFGPGGSFGAMSMLLNNRKAIRSVIAVTDVLLYQIPQAEFERLCRENEDFYNFFSAEFGRRMLRSGYASMLTAKPDATSGFQRSDLAFTLSVRELSDQQVHMVRPDQSIREVALSMSNFHHDYALIMKGEDPIGIVTDEDLRSKVIAEGRSYDLPIREIMSRPVRAISPDARAFEAILLMFRHHVHHLAVRDGDGFFGVVRLDRLLHGQGTSPFLFLHQIGQAASNEELKKRWKKAPAIIEDLIERGAKPEIVNQIVSSISDVIAINIVERSVRVLGTPPAPFVFMALGSEGRREQTLSTDQDNAIIYEDVEPERREHVRDYFLRLGERVSDDLNMVGFEYCSGGLMAKNPKWNHSLSHWKSRYTTWVQEPTPNNVMIGSTFFDCRAIYGSAALWEDLRGHILGLLTHNSQGFLGQLARAALINKPPLTFFGNLLFEDLEDKKKVLNIKRAMQTISDFARINALKHGLIVTNTGERLLELRKKEVLQEDEYRELHQSFYFMMRLRLTHQAGQMAATISPDNFLSNEEVSRIEKVTLKQIFRLIETYQKRIGLVYGGTMMG
ncbi:MAG: DUF294 nucleotidyltransferase-like domain-containing protein [Bacteroidia bacterium]|nr:DUF294 nucleotidyltransferase-like domain-containing protein [Bacteroidia bacterium]